MSLPRDMFYLCNLTEMLLKPGGPAMYFALRFRFSCGAKDIVLDGGKGGYK